jgi:hypothetical protein
VLKIASSSSRKPTADQLIEFNRSAPQKAVADAIGISPRHLQNLVGVPRNPDGTYNIRDVVAWDKKRSNGAATMPGDDPLLAGNASDSPNLERYRGYKADLAAIELAQKRGQLVNVEEFEAWWQTKVATPLTRAVESLRQLHGSEAAAIIERVLESVEGQIDQRMPGDEAE